MHTTRGIITRCPLTRPTFETVIRKIAVYNLNKLQRPTVDTKNDECDWKISIVVPGIIRF